MAFTGDEGDHKIALVGFVLGEFHQSLKHGNVLLSKFGEVVDYEHRRATIF